MIHQPRDRRALLRAAAIGVTMANEWIEKTGEDGRKLIEALRAK